MRLTTFADLIRHTINYMGKDASDSAAVDAREAVLDAYTDMAAVNAWNYYKRVFRLPTYAAYTTGTVVYDATGGAYERVLTLTGGVWPDWAAYGSVSIGDVSYQASERKSNTQLTLSRNANPGADVASTSYRLFRDIYTLPSDFLAVLEVSYPGYSECPAFISPQDFVRERARVTTGTGRPRLFTVMGDPNFFGSMGIGFWQYPDANYNVDITYTAKGRDLVISDYLEGTVTTAQGSSSITGNGTAFTSDMEGSVIRVGRTGDPKVTGIEGLYPYAVERTILEVIDAVTLRVDSPADATSTEVGYIISDAVDVEPNAMLRFLKRNCEKQARLKIRMKPSENTEEFREHEKSLLLAMQADSRYIGNRVAGAPYYWRRRLVDRGPFSFS